MSIRAQAAALQLSPAQVHKLRKRGMPADVHGAQSWRRVNMTGHRSKAQEPLPRMVRDLDKVRRIGKTALPDTVEEAERIHHLLTEAAEAAGERARQLSGHESRSADELGRKWSLLHADLLQRKLDLLERMQQLRVQAGDLMLASEARAVFGSFLRDMRKYAETLPTTMAIRTNPTDPEMARTALQEWLDGYFHQLHSKGAADADNHRPYSRGPRMGETLGWGVTCLRKVGRTPFMSVP